MKIVVAAIMALLAAASAPADCPSVPGVLPFAAALFASNGRVRLTVLQNEKAVADIQVFFYPEKDNPQGKVLEDLATGTVCGSRDRLGLRKTRGWIRDCA